MIPTVSVVIPTHSPHPGRLARTIAALQAQSLPRDVWELVIIDNRSPSPIELDIDWHPNARIVREDRLGLTKARLAGGAATRGEVVVFVDDDNLLAENYLSVAANLFAERPQLGAAGGKSIPEWEIDPEGWVQEFAGTLALRDLGDETRIAGPEVTEYPTCAPVGAGMAIRRSAWAAYVESLAKDPTAPADRTGTELTSGGDNDIVLRIIRAGWEVGYFPQLSLNHLIPAGRLSREYLARLNHGIAKSWVQVLGRHGICPFPPVAKWTVPLRKWRSYIRYRAWAGPAEYVRWRGACGHFEGLSLIRSVAGMP